MIFTLCFSALAVALVLTVYRLFRGPSAADRVLAIDLLAVTTAAAVLLYVLVAREEVFIDVVVVLGIIVFFGTVALARTISRKS